MCFKQSSCKNDSVVSEGIKCLMKMKYKLLRIKDLFQFSTKVSVGNEFGGQMATDEDKLNSKLEIV